MIQIELTQDELVAVIEWSEAAKKWWKGTGITADRTAEQKLRHALDNTGSQEPSNHQSVPPVKQSHNSEGQRG